MGIDIDEFVSPERISDTLQCSICTDVFQQPVFSSSGECQHTFCRHCANTFLERDPRCPICRQPLSGDDLRAHQGFQSLIDELHVRCSNRCGWTGQLDARSAHATVCLASRLAESEKMVQALMVSARERDAALEESRRALAMCQCRCLHAHVWILASNSQGTREVQQALEVADCDDTRVALVFGLRTHVWDALICPHANNVLQKFITLMQPVHSQFIIDELLQSGPTAVVRAARHRYGFRVLQRLLEHCSPDQKETITQDLLANAVPLCQHAFGNFVLQTFVEHGTMSEQMALACAILADPDLLVEMGCSRHGHAAVKQALQCAERYNMPQSSIALAELMGVMETLKANRYGRLLAAFVEESMTDVN